MLKYASRKELRDEERGVPIKCGKDLEKAAALLGAGKRVELNQPDEVSTLLDKLHGMTQDAIAKGEKAPTYDLCKVSVPKTNLFCQETVGVPRINMPQMKGTPVAGSEADKLKHTKKGEVDVGQQFIDHLKAKGISTEDTSVRASHLRASQNELDGAKVAGMVASAKAGTYDPKKGVLFVTRDNYILDGHHRWAAAVGLGLGKDKDFKLNVHKIDMDIGTAIREANDYTKQIGIKQKAVGT